LSKNILILNKFYNPHSGGIETVVEQHAEALADAGFKVSILVFFDKKSGHFKSNGRYKVIEKKPLFIIKKMPFSLSYVLHALFLSANSDVIIGHYPFPLFDFISFFIRGRKRSLYLVWHSEILRQKILRVFVAPFTRALVSRCKVITTSNSLACNSNFISKINVKVIPLGVNLKDYANDFESNKVEKSLVYNGHSLPSKYLLFFGRLTPYKNVGWFVKLARLLPNENFLVCGRGEESYLVSEAINSGVKNLFWVSEFLDHNQKVTVFRNARLYLFCSSIETEAYGITQVESLVVGTPVINQALCSGVPEVTSGIPFCRTVAKGDFNSYASEVTSALKESLSLSDRNEIVLASALRFDQSKLNNDFLSCFSDKIS
jgi:glycosyltransferase involved in cell wall biosynthesis